MNISYVDIVQCFYFHNIKTPLAKQYSFPRLKYVLK